MGKGPNGGDEFDFDSRGEGKGKGKGTKKSREVIKLEAVFHSGPRLSIPTRLLCILTLPSKKASCAPGIRPSLSPDPSLDRIRSFIHPQSPVRDNGHKSIAARSHARFRLLGVQLPIGSPPSVVPRSDQPSEESITCSRK